MKITKKFKGMLGLALSAMLTLGTVNVNAETTSKNPSLPDPDRKGSITIHKYAMDSIPNPGTPASGLEIKEENANLGDLPEGATPLGGVSFKIEKVADNTLPEQIAGNDTSKVVRDNSFEAKTITTANGENGTTKGVASINNLPQGIYLVTELENAGVTKPVNPFLVSIPMAHPTEANSWLYDVHVYPKNVIVTGEPSIDKDVTAENNKHDSANIGDKVTWIIKPSIPADIAGATRYVITDELDTKLNYTGNLETGNFEVYYYDNGDNKINFEAGTHYNKSEPTHANGVTGPTRDQKLVVTFTEDGIKLLAELYEAGIRSIRISFTTVINESAVLGQAIPNNATLDYTNSFGTNAKYDVLENNRPEVHTGGLLLEKVDASNHDTKLEGAKFKIYPTLEDAKAGTNAIMNPANKTEEWEVTTDTNGRAIFNGLSYGAAKVDENGNLITAGSINTQGSTKYWIVETVAPTYTVTGSNGETIVKQYNLLKAPLEVEVSATSHLEANKVVVENRKFTLPVTGGVGTVIFTLGGLAIMGAAAFLYMRTTRRA